MRATICGTLVVVLAGCGGKIDPGPFASPVGCLKPQGWEVRGVTPLNGQDTYELAAGSTERLWVRAAQSSSGCEEMVSGVEWHDSDPAVAVLQTTSPTSAVLTALSVGTTQVYAVVTHPDGSQSTAPGRRVRVVSAPPPVGHVVFEGEAALAGSGSRAYPTFDLAAPGRVTMTVDWSDARNSITAHLCPGVVTSGGCVTLIDGTRSAHPKPQRGSAMAPAAGPYTLWISSGGPGADVARYEVRLD